MPREINEEEEKYFLEVEAEKRREFARKLAEQAQALEARQQLARAAGTADPALAERIAALGFDATTVSVLDLLPLVHVAWADGRISRGERAAILGVAEARGIPAGDPARTLLTSLLDERPDEVYLQQSLTVLAELLKARGGSAAGEGLEGLGRGGLSAAQVVELCGKVAEASGGLFGLAWTASAVEQAKVEQVARALLRQA